MIDILLRRYLATIMLILIGSLAVAQDEEPSGLLGENFSLEAALESFKQVNSIQEFEENLNKEDNYIHNLDLNGDNEIDYISVNDIHEGDVHAIVISAHVGKNESQDIAVIEIEKDGPESAVLQIVGDEDMYGADMIVEPYDVETESIGKGPSMEMSFKRVVINVWLWPSVRYIYGPTYVVYRSPWTWAYYPRWWTPWRPRSWSVWRPFSVRYAPRYRITPVRRVTTARVIYTPKRNVSRTVTVRHSSSITKARTTKVSSRKTSTTVAVGKNSNGKAVAVKKNTGVKTANGTVKSTSKTKVKATNGKQTVKGSKKTTVKKNTKGKKKTKKVKKKKT